MSALVKTLIELERLKRLERTGWTLRGLPNGTESVASHSFGVGVTSMMIADLFVSHGIEVDIHRVLRLALIHDWAEVRVGDMPKTAGAYFAKEVRKRAEMAAFADVVSQLPEAQSYTELYDDYEQRRSLEARIVKVADVVDLLVEALALERAGHRGLNEFWQVVEERDFDLSGLARQLVDEVVDALVKTRNELYKSTPADT